MAKQKKGNSNKKRGNFLNRTLQRQILIPFLILITISVIIISITSYTISKDSLISEKVEAIEVQMEGLNNVFDTFFINKENILHRLSENDLIVNYEEDDYDELVNYLGATVNNDDEIINLYRVDDTDGSTVIYPEADLEGRDGSEREWYIASKEAEDGEIVWSEPYLDEATNQMVVTASQAFYKNGKLAGAHGADILVDSLIDMTKTNEDDDTTYRMIVSQNDNYILHPDESMIGASLTDESYYDDIQSTGNKGTIGFKQGNDNIFLGYTTNETTDWMISEAAYESDYIEIANSIIKPILITLGIVIILAVIVSVILTRRITTPIQRLQEVIREIEKGNLLASANVNSVNEIGHLAQGFNHMIEQMRTTLSKVKNISFNVAEASQTLVANAEENTAASNEVAITIEEIARGATDEAEMMEQNALATEQLSTLISEIESHNNEVFAAASEMNNVSKTGADTVQLLHTQSEETGKITSEVVHAIQSLDEKSANIGDIVTQIADIANQTNLLALNAAIEAARAGEHGRGFAIVAEEVRMLAEQSENSLGDISTLIEEIQTETGNSVALIQEVNGVIQSQTSSVDETSEAFSSIQETIEKTNDLINNVMTAMEAVVNQEEIISINTENIAAISEETAAGTEEVSASVEQQTASMEQLNHLAGELEAYSQEMQDRVATFIIEELEE